MGNMILAASSKGGSSSSTFLLILVVLVVLFYFVMIRPQSRKRRAVMEQQRQVQPGQRVRTTAGMYATVVAVQDDDVILEVAPGVESRFIKRAIMEVLPDDAPEDTDFADETDEAPDAEAGTVDAPAAEDDSEVGDDTPHHEDVTEESRTADSV
jgi:preprotein translocase subunit YajC